MKEEKSSPRISAVGKDAIKYGASMHRHQQHLQHQQCILYASQQQQQKLHQQQQLKIPKDYPNNNNTRHIVVTHCNQQSWRQQQHVQHLDAQQEEILYYSTTKGRQQQWIPRPPRTTTPEHSSKIYDNKDKLSHNAEVMANNKTLSSSKTMMTVHLSLPSMLDKDNMNLDAIFGGSPVATKDDNAFPGTNAQQKVKKKKKQHGCTTAPQTSVDNNPKLWFLRPKRNVVSLLYNKDSLARTKSST